jgi:hypothetical protein
MSAGRRFRVHSRIVPSNFDSEDGRATLRAIVDDLTLLWPTRRGGEDLPLDELVGHPPMPGESAAALFLWWACVQWEGLDSEQREQLIEALVVGALVDGQEFLAGFAATVRCFDFEPIGVRTAIAQLREPATRMASAVVVDDVDVASLMEGGSPLNSVLEYLTCAAWCLAAAARSDHGVWLSSLSGEGSRWLPVEGPLDEFLLNGYRSGVPFLISDPNLADALPRAAREWLRPSRCTDLDGALPSAPLPAAHLLLDADQLAAADGRRLRIPGSPGRAAVVFGRSWCDEDEIYVEGLFDDGEGSILPLELVGRNTLEAPDQPRYVCRARTQAFIPDLEVESKVSDTLLSAVALALGDAVAA